MFESGVENKSELGNFSDTGIAVWINVDCKQNFVMQHLVISIDQKE